MSWLRRAAVTDAFAQAADAPALALRELRVTMGGRVLIERLSMSAAGGELWCVVGPNGAGKSTLLGVLAGLRA
ncbi:ATP-binding cassette domain-containing protein, partial [Ralstonia pseudosolanacearum]